MVFKYNFAKAISYANKFSNKVDYFYQVPNENLGAGFLSQCILAGCDGVGKFEEWFFNNEKDFSLSWGNYEFLIKYLLKNNSGPFGRIVTIANVEVGDLVFFKSKNEIFSGGIITKFYENNFFYKTFGDAEDKKLDNFDNEKERIFIHVLGVKKN